MVKVNQHYLGCLAQAGYSIVSGDEVFIIDPRRDIDEYVQLLEDRGLKLVGVMLTHLHADFVAGHQEIARRFEAPIYVGRGAQAEYPHLAISDGMSVRFGDARLLFWETPGHTPGDVSALLFDESSGGQDPLAVFSGDTLFNGDVGRPDLLASFGISQDELAQKLYDSVQRLMTLPDATTLYPAHGAGSLCGKSLAAETWSTIGHQRLSNYAVQAPSREEFIRLVTSGQTNAPKYFAMDAVINKKGVSTGMGEIRARPRRLTAREISDLLERRDTVQFVDTRDADTFAMGFVPGFVNIGLDGWFATWAGTIVDPDRPIVFIAPEGRVDEAIVRFARVGLENVQGYFLAEDLPNIPLPLVKFEHLGAAEVQRLVARGEAVLVDVRAEGERAAMGVVEPSLAIPLGEFSQGRILAALPDNRRRVVTMCAGGYRSSTAASLLVAWGFANVADVAGGYATWQG